MDETKIDQVLGGLQQLPVMPAVVQEVIDSFGRPGLDVATLAGKIAADGGLTAKVLRVANSAFYGLPRQVGSIHEAVVLLGFGIVRSLVVAAALQDTFPVADAGALDREAFWHRGMQCGVCARALAKGLGHDPGMAFVAGLLRDVGLVALDVCLRARLAEVLAQVKASGADLIETERALLGFDHAVIGAEVTGRWNFPAVLQDAIRYGQGADAGPSAPLTDVVRAAGALVSALQGGAAGQDKALAIPEAVRTRLGLSQATIEACLSELEQAGLGQPLGGSTHVSR